MVSHTTGESQEVVFLAFAVMALRMEAGLLTVDSTVDAALLVPCSAFWTRDMMYASVEAWL